MKWKEKNNYRVTIPLAIVNALGWKCEDVIEFHIDSRGRLYIENKTKKPFPQAKALKKFKDIVGYKEIGKKHQKTIIAQKG